MSRLPPGLLQLVVAAAGAAALVTGIVMALNGVLAGIAIAVGGVLLLAWSVFGRLRP